jgi:hypothetical protein
LSGYSFALRSSRSPIVISMNSGISNLLLS